MTVVPRRLGANGLTDVNVGLVTGGFSEKLFRLKTIIYNVYLVI